MFTPTTTNNHMSWLSSLSLFFLLLLTPQIALSHTPTPAELRLLKRALNKPVVQPNFYDTKLDTALQNLLAPADHTISQWTNNLIPATCKDRVESRKYNGTQLSASDVEVFNVTYDDCDGEGDRPWVFCRHKDAEASQDTLAEMFGRLPVRMRSYLKHLVAVPGVASASTSDSTVVIVGGAVLKITVYGHEIGHILDSHAFEGYQTGFSVSQTWTSAFNSDQAVCQSYALVSQQENLAQMINVALYDQNYPQQNSKTGTGISSLCANWEEFGNQLRVLNDNIGDTLNPGGRCVASVRPQDSTYVDKGGKQQTAGCATTTTTTGVAALGTGDVVISSIAAATPTGFASGSANSSVIVTSTIVTTLNSTTTVASSTAAAAATTTGVKQGAAVGSLGRVSGMLTCMGVLAAFMFAL